MAFIKVSMVLNVNEKASIKIAKTINESFSLSIRSKKAKSGLIFEFKE